MSGLPAIRVLVVNHNSGPWLARCLEGLRTQTLGDFEVVIVDNGSADGSADVPLPDARFRLERAGENLGFAAANNRAAQGATAAWLALLNPDAVPEPTWLGALMREVERHPSCRIVGSTQIAADDDQRLDGTGDCLSGFGLAWRSGHGKARVEPLPDGPVFAACGAAMLIERALFERLEGFEERFFCYVEDVDLCFRARLLGETVWQSSRARVRHAGGASSEGGRSPFALYHGGRNLVWMLGRNLPIALLLIALVGTTGFTLLRLLMPREGRQRIALWNGLRDGFRGLPSMLADRSWIQRQRRVSAFAVARWLSWNPVDVLKRRFVRS